MKQNITKEQWDELNDRQKLLGFLDNIMIRQFGSDRLFSKRYTPSIGEMIQFLGDDWDRQAMEQSNCIDSKALLPENICDSLWEAVKQK